MARLLAQISEAWLTTQILGLSPGIWGRHLSPGGKNQVRNAANQVTSAANRVTSAAQSGDKHS